MRKSLRDDRKSLKCGGPRPRYYKCSVAKKLAAPAKSLNLSADYSTTQRERDQPSRRFGTISAIQALLNAPFIVYLDIYFL